MATGQLPFRGSNAMAVLIALTTETPKPVRELAPNLPPAVAELIDRLMSKDAAGRPQSAEEVAAAVRQVVKDLQARKAVPAPAAPPEAAPSSSQPMPVVTLPAPAPSPWEDVTEEESKPAAAKKGGVPWLLAGGALALAAVLAVVVIRLQTAEGTLVVELSDPGLGARFKDGRLALVGPDGKERYTLSVGGQDRKIDAGAYTIRVVGADGLALDTREFTLRKNGQVTVRVTLDPKIAKKDEPKQADPAATLTGKQPAPPAERVAELLRAARGALKSELSSNRPVDLSQAAQTTLTRAGSTVRPDEKFRAGRRRMRRTLSRRRWTSAPSSTATSSSTRWP